MPISSVSVGRPCPIIDLLSCESDQSGQNDFITLATKIYSDPRVEDEEQPQECIDLCDSEHDRCNAEAHPPANRRLLFDEKMG